MKTDKEVYLYVSQVRKKLRLPVKDFARVLGVQPTSIYSWESGATQPPGPAMLLMQALDISPVDTISTLCAADLEIRNIFVNKWKLVLDK